MIFLINILILAIEVVFNVTDEDRQNYRRDVLGEFTREELIQIEREEKRNYNRNIRSAFWWSGSKTWIDADGIEREF